MGAFVEGPANTNEVSLGDIARQYKAHRATAHPREFNNSNIRHSSYGTADTNAAALPQGDQASATYGSTGSATVPEGVMNAGDYAAVQAALARSQAATNTSATNNVMASNLPDPNRTGSPAEAQDQHAASANATQPQATANTANNPGATTPEVNAQANASQGRTGKQLPASSSELPLVALLGLIALTVGGIFAHRARRSEVRV
jgi:cobalamin biosynthesis Mg chelatase CobN